MKKQLCFIVSVVILTLALNACKNVKSGPVSLKTYHDSLSYAIGFLYGNDIVNTDYDFDLNLIFKGIANAQNPDLMILSEDQIRDLMMRFQSQVTEERMQSQENLRVKNQAEGKLFMEENAKKEGVISTASGLQYKVLRSGSGKKVSPSSTVKAHYTGMFLNGDEFDSSYNYGEPMEFQVDMVIDGWSEGLALMREGDIFELYIPDSLAYGEMGYSIIEPGAYLIFRVELLEVVK